MVSLDAALRHVKEGVGGLLDARSIGASCAAHGHEWQSGPLDPAATVGLMLRQVAEGNVAGSQVVRMAGGAFTESAWCQARQTSASSVEPRLPLAVLADAADAVAGRVREAAGGEADWQWRGRRVRLMDASNFSMADTPELRAHFGDVPGQKPG